jgi:glycosyltransferase involved in cell wall biosynthesis
MSVALHSVLEAASACVPEGQNPPVELSIVMPCLNEAETLSSCLVKADRALREYNVAGEIIVADNGSTDGSQTIADRMGARVIHVEAKGYGNALMGGIAASRGEYIIMGDADDSYDFSSLMPFLDKLRDGYDLVMGNRFKGGIKPGAMHPLNKYLGNPVLTGIGRLFFRSPCGDFHCGLRGFRKEAVMRMDLRSTGMEFASEMVVKATLQRMRITEVETTLSPDGRSRPPHLRRWRDGWRHLRFLLLYSPRWLFLYPGILLVFLGLATGLWLLPAPRSIGGVTFDVHTLLYSAAAVLIGFQSILFTAFAKVFAINEGLLPPDPRMEKLARIFTLEKGLCAGAVLTAIGVLASVYALSSWGRRSFGPMDPSQTLRIVIPAVLALSLGCQTILSSFLLSMLAMARK